MTVKHAKTWREIPNWPLPGFLGCGLSRGILRGAPLWFVVAALSLHSTAAAAEAPPMRIISTAPSVTEMLYALGLGDRVVGVTTYCHYPPEVRQKPKIGSYMYPNLETMLELRADLVVILKEHAGLGERIRKVGLNVLELQHNSLAGIYESLRMLGKLAAVEATAETTIEEIQSALDEIRSRARNLPRRSVLFLVGRTPGTIRDLMVVGRGAFLNELIDIAGGRNLFRDSAAFYPKIGLEELYAGRPEVIIDMGDMSDTDRVTEEHRRSVAALWQKYPMLPAVQAGRVYAVANDVFVVPGPRVVEAAAELLRMIHPETAR
jgi:iron complex transport system substrate-binding protein